MTYSEAVLTDPTLAAGVRQGLPLEEIIALLVSEKKTLLGRIEKLEQIAPFKIRTAEGMMIWHCPDEFVPERS